MGFIHVRRPFPMKDHKNQPKRVQRRDENTDQDGNISQSRPRNRRMAYSFDNRILGKESGKRWNARQGQTANNAGAIGYW